VLVDIVDDIVVAVVVDDIAVAVAVVVDDIAVVVDNVVDDTVDVVVDIAADNDFVVDFLQNQGCGGRTPLEILSHWGEPVLREYVPARREPPRARLFQEPSLGGLVPASTVVQNCWGSAAAAAAAERLMTKESELEQESVLYRDLIGVDKRHEID